MGEETYCKKYKHGSCNSDAISKYGMVKSGRTFRLPLKSALKATFNMSGSTENNGKFPSFLTPSPPAPLCGSAAPLCSVSPALSSQHGPSVPTSVHDYRGGGPVAPRKVSFATVLQYYTPTGDIHFSKISILSPGLLLFRERTKNKLKPTRRSYTDSASAWSSISSATPQETQRPVSPPRTSASPTRRTALPPAIPSKHRDGPDLQ